MPQNLTIFEANILNKCLMKYNWQLENWANFTYDASIIDSLSIEFAIETGELKGLIESLPDTIQ